MKKITYPSRYDEVLRQWADSRGSSIEIAQAIWSLSQNDPIKAERLWEEPSTSEIEEVTRLAFDIQYTDFPDPELQDICLYWGEQKVWFME